jgi:hypothetical protein
MISLAQDKKPENLCLSFKAHKISAPGNQILVMGEVMWSGFIQAREGQTFFESVARVGGVERKANIKKIQILRCSPDFETVEKNIFVDYKKIIHKTEIDVVMEGGDIIIVRKSRKMELPEEYFERVLNPSLPHRKPTGLYPKIFY